MRPFAPRCGALNGAARISRSFLRTTCQPKRFYSLQPEAASTSKPQDIDASRLTVEETKNPKPLLKNEELIFGQTFTGQCSHGFGPPGIQAVCMAT